MLGKIDCYATSHIGLVRQTNEDNFVVATLHRSLRILQSGLDFDDATRLGGGNQGLLIVVADGMGGHQAGERASQLAVEAFMNYLVNDATWRWTDDNSPEAVHACLCGGVNAAKRAIADDARLHPDHAGMGTTLTAAIVHWPAAFIAHVGDSRCYHIRGSEIRQLTIDHTVEQLREDLAKNAATEEQQERFAGVDWQSIGASHALWNVIASEVEQLDVQLVDLTLDVGDRLLLCSDGLSRLVETQSLQQAVSQNASARAICERLIELALDGGGGDNITAALAVFRDGRTRRRGEMTTSLTDTIDFDEPFSVEENVINLTGTLDAPPPLPSLR